VKIVSSRKPARACRAELNKKTTESEQVGGKVVQAGRVVEAVPHQLVDRDSVRLTEMAGAY
jgi:hypothetical protein